MSKWYDEINTETGEIWTLSEVQNKYIQILSIRSFSKKEELIPKYKVENSNRGNIYSTELNSFWIQEDKDRAKDCRDEYYRIKALILSAGIKEDVESAFELSAFDSIVLSGNPPE